MQAMEGGAQAGLGLARNQLEAQSIQNQAQEAANRVALSYAQIAAERQSAADKLRAAMEQQDMLNLFRQGNLDARNRQVDVAEANAQQRSNAADALKQIHTRTGIYGYDPKSGKLQTLMEFPQEMSQLEKFDLQKAEKDLNQARTLYGQMQIYGTDEQKAQAAAALMDASRAYEQMRKTVTTPGTGAAGALVAPPTSTGTTPPAGSGQSDKDWWNERIGWLRGGTPATPAASPLTAPKIYAGSVEGAPDWAMGGQTPVATMPDANNPIPAFNPSAATALTPSASPVPRKRYVYNSETGELMDAEGSGPATDFNVQGP